ncbi:stimulator of interferon genes protein isoform X4 [Anser cygnoides]|uniref:stimulator of interferon genes protein isoform X4 n=1 Tax=Anser cygnoides TaxID=8845 RepID=UPI0034D309DD
MRLCPWHREQAQALLAAAASEGRRKRCLSGLGAAHSAHSARSPGSSRCRGRGRSAAAADPPVCCRCLRNRSAGAAPLPCSSPRPGKGERSARCTSSWPPAPRRCAWLGSPCHPLPTASPPTWQPCRSGPCSRAAAAWQRRSSTSSPGIKESMEEISKANPNVQACRETWKLHILIPLSCNVWDDLEKADSNIQYLTDLTETTLTRGGIKKRVYKHSFYAIRDGDNQARHCAVEYATPLQTLYAMSQDECAAFSRDDRLEQAKLFYRTLEEILRGSKECTGTYRLIAYEEPREAEPHFLSREILWHLRQQQQEEFTVHEGTPPRTLATALGSTDLSLQISASDLPQPLRSDHP